MAWKYRKKSGGDWKPCTKEHAEGLQRTAEFRRKFEVKETKDGAPTPSATTRKAKKEVPAEK